jgi:hypothetical protein
MIQTSVQMMMTPAQVGTRPLETAERQEAPLIELLAFNPVVEIMEMITRRVA